MRLVVDNATVRYPRAPRSVLDGASLAVAVGEKIAVLGPSGSGKSTLLALMGGLIRPLAGTVYLEGRGPERAQRCLRSSTAWVLQTVNVLPERSAVDNVAIGALTKGISPGQARVEAAAHLAAVGLGDRLNDAPKLMSGGEVQRLVIARAMASGRPFILADEPTGQLDRTTSDMVLDALFGAADATAIVVVTHDPLVARRCERQVRIVDGRVETS